jgi:hypothetical protein
MYFCQVTKRQSKEGEKINKIVIETRVKEYKHWDREEETEWYSHGNEIVREVNATSAGLDRYNSWSAEEKAAFAVSFPSTGG